MEDTKDAHFNWVEALRECSIGSVFEELKRIAEENVEERNNDYSDVLANTGYELFKLESYSDDQFVVKRGVNHRLVSFVLRNNDIRIEMGGLETPTLFSVTTVVNELGKQIIQIDGEGDFLHWQVSRRALEPLFFFE